MSAFAVEVEEAKDRSHVVVYVRGDVDLQTSPELWSSLQKVLQRKTAVAVDLSRVDYIDSSGVAVLIQGLKQAGRTSTTFGLRAPSERVMAVLRLAQLTQLFRIDPAGREA